MKYTALGSSDLTVSRICLGCMGFGEAKTGMHSWTVSEEDTQDIITRALDGGINFFDTALVYQEGSSERYVGRALKKTVNREDVIVATKFPARPKQPKEPNQPNGDSELSAKEHIQRCLDQSLTNLGMDYVDLYIYHFWDWGLPITEVMEALNAQVQAGKVRALGISNCFSWQVAQANEIARYEGWAPLVSYQGHLNALYREEEREILPYTQLNGLAYTPYSALASGRLARRPGAQATQRMAQDAYAHHKYDAAAELDRPIIDRVAQLADQHGVSMTEIALSWLLTRVTAPIVGATKLHHLDAPLSAVDLDLPPTDVESIDALYRPHAVSGMLADNRKPGIELNA